MYKNYDFIWEDDSTGENLVIPNTRTEPIYTIPKIASPPLLPDCSFADLLPVNDSLNDTPAYSSVEPYQGQNVQKSPLFKLKGNSKKSSLRYVIIICRFFNEKSAKKFNYLKKMFFQKKGQRTFSLCKAVFRTLSSFYYGLFLQKNS